jgi:hypothetical protein
VNLLNGIVNFFRFDRTNWKAVALCLLAATVFWFFNALNKEHTATISFPIYFKYDQAGFIPLKAFPEDVQLNVTGSGWDLLRKSLRFKVSPVQITLDKPNRIMRVPPATVLALAAGQIGQTKINHVASDTLVLAIEPKKKKKVKLVLPRSQVRFELGYGLSSPITISPDSVFILGPASIILNMPDSLLLPFSPARNSNNVNTDVDLAPLVDSPVSINPNSTHVVFDVSELEDVEMSVKVIVLPAAPFKSQVSADSVSVTFRLPSKQKANLKKASGLFAVIDLQVFEPGISKVAPAIKGRPLFSEVVSMDSVTVRKY